METTRSRSRIILYCLWTKVVKKMAKNNKNIKQVKTIKIVSTPLTPQTNDNFHALGINEKISSDYNKWLDRQTIKICNYSYEYTVDYTFKKGANFLIYANNASDLETKWDTKIYIGDKLVASGITNAKNPLGVKLLFTNNAMVPKKSLRGFFRTKTIRGMQLIKRPGFVKRIKELFVSGSN